MLACCAMLFSLVLVVIFSRVSMVVNVNVLILISVGVLLSMKSGVSYISFCSFFSLMGNFSCVMVFLLLWVSAMMLLASLVYEQEGGSSMVFSILVMALLIIMSLFFITSNLVIMYIFFELSLIPTLLLILKWGYQPERLQASFYFVIYTICASLPLLFVIMKLKMAVYSSAIFSLMPFVSLGLNYSYPMIVMASIMAFLVKAPMWGVHLWLPKAHVEAPISGSMVLAGVLLKLGGFGLMQILGVLYKVSVMNVAVWYSVSVWGAVVVGFVCLLCVDMKVLIAYSSVIHMNLMLAGVLSMSLVGVKGAMLMMISHGFSSPAMFVLANFNYSSSKTRNFLLHKGLAKLQPVMALMWFMAVAANMAAPPSFSLAGELLIFMSVLSVSIGLFVFLGLITFLSGAYNLYLYSSQQGSSFGVIKPFKCFFSKEYVMIISLLVPVYLLILNMSVLC